MALSLPPDLISIFLKQTPWIRWLVLLVIPFFLPNHGLSQSTVSSPSSSPSSKKIEPCHFAVALAQPGEAKTVAWLNASPLWEGESFQGYGFGEWNWPAGMLSLVLKNPEREDLAFKTQTVSGECYLLGVDSTPNPDPQKKARHPRITTAHCVAIKSPKPENKSFIYGVSFIQEPLNLEVNGQKLTLKFAEPIQFSTGTAMIKENGQILTSSDPQDPCIIALAFFKNAEGKVYVINSRFY